MAKKKIKPRYVDANLVKEALLGWDEDPSDEDLEYAIDNIPTADVEEVKHGEWIVHNKTMYGSDYSCSLCGNIADEDNRGNFAILTKYCSNCGAKMDGGKEE